MATFRTHRYIAQSAAIAYVNSQFVASSGDPPTALQSQGLSNMRFEKVELDSVSVEELWVLTCQRNWTQGSLTAADEAEDVDGSGAGSETGRRQCCIR